MDTNASLPLKTCYFRDAELVTNHHTSWGQWCPKGKIWGSRQLRRLRDAGLSQLYGKLYQIIFTLPETNSKSTWKLLQKEGLPPFLLGFDLVFVCYVQLRSQINVHIRSLLPANWKLKWGPKRNLSCFNEVFFFAAMGKKLSLPCSLSDVPKQIHLCACVLPAKTNMEAEHDGSQKEFVFPEVHFSGSMSVDVSWEPRGRGQST